MTDADVVNKDGEEFDLFIEEAAEVKVEPVKEEVKQQVKTTISLADLEA